MNKIKILYDVVQTMRKQETFEGTVQFEVAKDSKSMFKGDNVFERNMQTGISKIKSKTEVDRDGFKMKNESELEMNGQHEHDFGHMQGRHPSMSFGNGFRRSHGIDGEERQGRRGMKDRWQMVAMALDMLNKLEVEKIEEEMKFLELRIRFMDLPKDLQKQMKNRLFLCKQVESHEHMKAIKDIKSLEDIKVHVSSTIKSNNCIDQLNIELDGQYLDNEDQKHEIYVNGELQMK